MRTIDATLQTALATFHFVPYFKLKVYRNGALLTTLDVIKYKLTGTHLSVTTRGLISISSSPESIKLILERGIVSEGANYVLDSSKFTPITGTVQRLRTKSLFISTTIEAELIPPKYVSFDGSASYLTVITSFCTAIGKTPAFKNPTADFWDAQFMPYGTTVTLNDARMFLPLLQQKHLIFCCDNGGEEILFYCALDIPAGAYDASINPVLYDLGTGYFSRKRFMAVDEITNISYAGTVGDPLFNLGYKYSADGFPTVYAQSQPIEFTIPINLNYQDGDFYGIDGNGYSLYPAEVIEVFDVKANPGWSVNIRQLIYFSSTEGGSLPSGLAAKAPFMPVNTSMFDHVLDASCNNVQACFDKLDDHSHAAGAGDVAGPAGATADDIAVFDGVTGKVIKDGGKKVADLISHSLATAANDFLVASGAGAFVKKTLAETVTILRTALDSVYKATFAYTAEDVANKDTDGTLAANSDTKYASQKATKTYVDAHAGGVADHIPANTTALTQTEGYLRWDSTRKHIILWDVQRERGITPVGWLPFAYPICFDPLGAFTATLSLAIGGGSVAIPMLLSAPMLLESAMIRNLDTATARQWGWDLYEQYLNNGNAGENTLTRIAASNGNETFTPTAASNRTLAATGAPVFLAPGVYWLVVQNRSASVTFALGAATISGTAFNPNIAQTKATTNPNGATLDFVAATWAKTIAYLPAARLNGRVFGQTAAF